MIKKQLAAQIALVVITVIGLGAVIGLLIMPATGSLRSTLDQRKQLSDTISQAKERLGFLQQQNRQKATIESRYDAAVRYLPDSSDQSNLILQLGEIGKQAGLIVTRIAIADPANDTVEFSGELIGSYQATSQFFTSLKQMLRANEIATINLEVGQNSVKTTLTGKAFFKPIPKDLAFEGERPAKQVELLDSLTQFGDPIKPQEQPGGSPEPFGTF